MSEFARLTGCDDGAVWVRPNEVIAIKDYKTCRHVITLKTYFPVKETVEEIASAIDRAHGAT